MTNDEIESQVIELIAGATEGEVDPTSRLLEDLGIDGDNALELFADIHRRFDTDFSPLYERWREHFGPQGIPSWAGFLVLAPAVGVVLLAWQAFGDFVATLLAMSVVAAASGLPHLIARQARLTKNIAPITVAQVVRATQEGAWPRPFR